MREILFRGLTQDRDWVYWNVYGELVGIGGKRRTRYEYHRTENSISYYCHISQLRDSKLLIKETIGQFTGAIDKDGKKIFDGDILREEFKEGAVAFLQVVWDEEYRCYELEEVKTKQRCQLLKNECACVIGNIHDNPELLEVK